MRSASYAVNYKKVERLLNTLTVPIEVRGWTSLLLASDTYVPFDVNIFMEGLRAMSRHMFMEKVKGGLSTPFQLWSWKKGGSSGVSTHFLWRIPSKANHTLRAEGEAKTAVIVGEITINQERHYSRAVMTAYMGTIVNPDFISTKVAAKAI